MTARPQDLPARHCPRLVRRLPRTTPGCWSPTLRGYQWLDMCPHAIQQRLTKCPQQGPQKSSGSCRGLSQTAFQASSLRRNTPSPHPLPTQGQECGPGGWRWGLEERWGGGLRLPDSPGWHHSPCPTAVHLALSALGPPGHCGVWSSTLVASSTVPFPVCDSQHGRVSWGPAPRGDRPS